MKSILIFKHRAPLRKKLAESVPGDLLWREIRPLTHGDHVDPSVESVASDTKIALSKLVLLGPTQGRVTEPL